MAQSDGKACGRVGRGRPVVGWVLAVMGVVVAGVWGASRWWGGEAHYGKYKLMCIAGTMALEVTNYNMPGSHRGAAVWAEAANENWEWTVSTDRHSELSRKFGWSWKFICYDVHASSPFVYEVWRVVLWPVPLLLWGSGCMFLWWGKRVRRLTMTGHCTKCGYDMAGLGLGDGVRCPECAGERG